MSEPQPFTCRYSASGHIEVWCMHQKWRDVVAVALAAGNAFDATEPE